MSVHAFSGSISQVDDTRSAGGMQSEPAHRRFSSVKKSTRGKMTVGKVFFWGGERMGRRKKLPRFPPKRHIIDNKVIPRPNHDMLRFICGV